MSVIEVKELTKVFKIPKKEPGLGGAARLLFLGYRFWQFGLRYYSGTGT